MRILYSISALNSVVLDLYWGFPPPLPGFLAGDYLDATCLAYAGNQYQFIVDYDHRAYYGIVHSGDIMDGNKKEGHHTIKINLKEMPSKITSLFFTLSAYYSNNIALFQKPSVKLFDPLNQNKELCKYSIESVGDSQAVIMCYISRRAGGWKVFVVDQRCNGNAKNYAPIVTKIQDLFASGNVS